jgi:hypothetical protein
VAAFHGRPLECSDWKQKPQIKKSNLGHGDAKIDETVAFLWAFLVILKGIDLMPFSTAAEPKIRLR